MRGSEVTSCRSSRPEILSVRSKVRKTCHTGSRNNTYFFPVQFHFMTARAVRYGTHETGFNADQAVFSNSGAATVNIIFF